MRPRVVALLRLLALVVGVLATAGCGRDGASDPLPGVRLGMTPRDVRDRFEGGAGGTWQTRLGGGPGGSDAGVSDDTVLEWSASGDGGRATSARFEFHLGMLVAVRAHLRQGLPSERVELTAKTVTLLAPGAGAGGTDVTILSRDCPTHRVEAETVAAKALK